MHFLQLALFALFLWFVGDNVLRGNIRRIIKLYLLYIIYIYRARLCGEKVQKLQSAKSAKVALSYVGVAPSRMCVPCRFGHGCVAVSDFCPLRIFADFGVKLRIFATFPKDCERF